MKRPVSTAASRTAARKPPASPPPRPADAAKSAETARFAAGMKGEGLGGKPGKA